jgi:4-hydroxythreonine-4-phosphate dehydrogenase
MPAKPMLLTMGDACGIGPEIIVRACLDGAAEGCLVVGEPEALRRASRLLGVTLPLALVEACADLDELPPNCLPVLRPPALPAGLAALPWGRVHAACGAAAALCIEEAARCLLDGRAAAMVTAPLHKEALAAAGIGFPGHTEMLQSLATPPGAAPAPVRMMLANDELRVVLVSIHVALRRAVDLVDIESVLQTIRIAHEASRAWGQPRPRIAVAGLNPHAGEGGLFGDEEQRFIAPAIEAARRLGIDASGPYAPDTVFMRARHAPGHAGEFDLVVAMTHDHGLIPVKYLGVEQGVNVTLGLPFVRTSPDHGTAFDIAGTGKADASSLKAALRLARRLVGVAADDRAGAVRDPRG